MKTVIGGIEVIDKQEIGAMIQCQHAATDKFIKREGLQSMRVKGRVYYAKAAVEAAIARRLGLQPEPAPQTASSSVKEPQEPAISG